MRSLSRHIRLRSRPVRQLRAGLSLIEVLAALAILGAGLAAVTRLTAGGAAAATRVELDTEAAIRCQSQIEALLAGAIRPPSNGWTDLVDDPAWQWHVETSSTGQQGLLRLAVAVRRADGDERFGVCRLECWIRRNRWDALTGRRGR